MVRTTGAHPERAAEAKQRLRDTLGQGHQDHGVDGLDGVLGPQVARDHQVTHQLVVGNGAYLLIVTSCDFEVLPASPRACQRHLTFAGEFVYKVAFWTR
jgi:hypothetical protein